MVGRGSAPWRDVAPTEEVLSIPWFQEWFATVLCSGSDQGRACVMAGEM